MNEERQKKLDNINIRRNELINHQKEINISLAKLNDEITEILIEGYKEISGLEVGDTVEFKERNSTKTGVIERFANNYGNIVPVVLLHKKDGSVGLLRKDYWTYNAHPTKINV